MQRLVAGASSGGDDHECCVPVVDSNTFIFTIGGAAVAVWFLRLGITYISDCLHLVVVQEHHHLDPAEKEEICVFWFSL